MKNFLKYASLAPVLLTLWLSFTSAFIILLNFISPDALSFPNYK